MKAQAGNHKRDLVVKEKQLEVHPDKTGSILIGNNKFQERMIKETLDSPIMFCDIAT